MSSNPTALHDVQPDGFFTQGLAAADPAVFALLDPSDGRAAAERNPLVEYRTIAGAGHSIHRDRPAETLAALDDWLARLSPRR